MGFLKSFSLKEHLQNAIRNNKKLIIVIRHAERYHAKKGTFGEEIPLTFRGRKASELLGKTIAEIPVPKIHTSPVLRCVNTAKELRRGSRQKSLIEETKVLGDPGPFTADPKEAGPIFLTKPLLEIAQAIADGEAVPGMRGLSAGSKLFLNYALGVSAQLTLMITHDVIISLLCSFLFEDRDVKKYIPNFLEGFIIEQKENELVIYHKQAERHLTWDRLGLV